MKRDYLVYAPPYRFSGGIRVLHLLAHHLNNRGYNAFVPTDKVNPAHNIISIRNHDDLCRLSDYWIKHEPVIVYPEVISGNPLGYKHIARYVLNKPGFLGGDTAYAKSEMVFAFNKYCQSFCPGGTPILEIPSCELELFNCNNPVKRSGGIFWVYKGANVPRVKDTETMREITHGWPPTRPELAQLLQGSDIFYSYDNNTGLLTEARLCGCPTVIIPDPSLKLTKDDPLFISTNGLAWGNSPDEIQHARDTVHLFKKDHLNHIKGWERQLDNFIKITQG